QPRAPALECVERHVQLELVTGLDVLDDDPFGGRNLEETVAHSILGAVGRAHDEFPPAAGAELEDLEEVHGTLRSPPTGEDRRIRERLEDSLGRRRQDALRNDLVLGLYRR